MEKEFETPLNNGALKAFNNFPRVTWVEWSRTLPLSLSSGVTVHQAQPQAPQETSTSLSITLSLSQVREVRDPRVKPTRATTSSESEMDVYGVSAAECFPYDDLLDFSNDQLFTTTDSASVQYYTENNYAAATGGGHCNANQYYSADFTHDLCVPVSTISLQSSVFVSVTGSCSIT